MFSFFPKARLLDSSDAEQLQHCFQWLLDHFDHNYFDQHTQLIQPIRSFFPDRADNELDMAQALSARIISYAGLAHWPFYLVPPQLYTPKQPALLQLNVQSRQQAQITAQALSANKSIDSFLPNLDISYSSAMMKKPMDLVGSMSKNIAQHVLFQSQLVPPSGPESFDACAEMLAIMMGFGIFIANSAYTFRGSCARCYDPQANRSAALSEDESIYCLALFAHHKNISDKEACAQLKAYLRPSFKKARKQIKRELSVAA
ncbi:hypothetical protein [Agaribacterium sp. ZY112]|uniref:hypothetical protein n=1 Tax=Agaribacterium sp. ZY112 TaxID=3233574 RepID=UPI003523C434